ncbi:hypothetical protein BDN72DRAFT_780752, partial [Pluteus cervinus]
GHVGAVIREGESFITSPNSSFIPQPPLGGDRSVFLREDFRYGDDDPLQWPQPFVRSLLFLSAIPLISGDNHPLAVMSDDLSWSDFAEDDNDLLSGIGKIKNTKCTELSVLSAHILGRAERFSQSKPATSVANLLGEYTHLLHLYLYRLQHVTTNFSNTRFTFRGLQRIYLYLQALLDWEETFRPRLHTNKEGAGVPVAQVLGAFTTSTELGDILYHMGVPVWFIRPSREVVNAHVRDLADLNPPSTSLVLGPSQYQRFSIFKGQNNDPAMYGKIMYQLHTHIRYPNPFGRDVAPINPLAPPLMSSSSPLPSSSTSSLSLLSSAPTGRLSSQKSSKRLTPYQDRKNRSNPQPGDPGREKFTDPPSPILPPALPVWLSALQNVNRFNQPSFHSSNDALDLSYVFPEPASLVVVTNVGRLSSMFKTWLRFRPAFFYRLTNDNSNATPMPARVWKDFLTVNFLESNPNKKSTDTPAVSRSARTLAYAQDFYQSLLNEDGVRVTNASRPSLPSTWRGKPFDTLVNSDFQEILWEINELSFRFEFMALDSRLSSDADKPFHQVDVDECFPTVESGSLLVVDVTNANSGIASNILDQRGRALLAIRTVMQKWDGRPLPPLIASTHAVAWDNIDSLEREIAVFYTQSFFNYFHRAPIIPRWLPHLPQTVLPSPFRHKMMNARPNIYYDLGILDRGV